MCQSCSRPEDVPGRYRTSLRTYLRTGDRCGSRSWWGRSGGAGGARTRRRGSSKNLFGQAPRLPIARRHGVSRALLYSWRRAARCAPVSPVAPATPDFVPVPLSALEQPHSAPATIETSVPVRASRRAPKRSDGGGEIEVVLPGGARLTLRGRVEGTALRAVLAALKA